jgi:hypothetical protein
VKPACPGRTPTSALQSVVAPLLHLHCSIIPMEVKHVSSFLGVAALWAGKAEDAAACLPSLAHSHAFHPLAQVRKEGICAEKWYGGVAIACSGADGLAPPGRAVHAVRQAESATTLTPWSK